MLSACRLVLSATLTFAPAALAHAFLARADPAVGSTVNVPPASLTLEFTGPIEAAFSSVTVTEIEGRQPVAAGETHNPKPDTLTLPLPKLGAGTYQVRWKVLSVDSHETEGTFKFTVGAH